MIQLFLYCSSNSSFYSCWTIHGCFT